MCIRSPILQAVGVTLASGVFVLGLAAFAWLHVTQDSQYLLTSTCMPGQVYVGMILASVYLCEKWPAWSCVSRNTAGRSSFGITIEPVLLASLPSGRNVRLDMAVFCWVVNVDPSVSLDMARTIGP